MENYDWLEFNKIKYVIMSLSGNDRIKIQVVHFCGKLQVQMNRFSSIILFCFKDFVLVDFTCRSNANKNAYKDV